MEYFNSLDTSVKAAIITSAFTLIGIITKDLLIFWWRDRHYNRRQALSIYRHYANPIESATQSLFWRLHEILGKKSRGTFLISRKRNTQFSQYKYDSTLYRIAALIGWLRAYRRELTIFSLDNPTKLDNLEKSIQNFEHTLAEGAHVEIRRVHALEDVLKLPTIPKEKVSELGIALDQVLQGELEAADVNIAKELNKEKKPNLCTNIISTMERFLDIKPLQYDSEHEICEQIISAISIREAWLYRDFQYATGDLMINEISDGSRRFEVLGFGDFEKLLSSRDDDVKRWMLRLRAIVDDLDISTTNNSDARLDMLKGTFCATYKLLVALDSLEPGRKIVSSGINDAANEIC